jgi:hypothetical protein
VLKGVEREEQRFEAYYILTLSPFLCPVKAVVLGIGSAKLVYCSSSLTGAMQKSLGQLSALFFFPLCSSLVTLGAASRRLK